MTDAIGMSIRRDRTIPGDDNDIKAPNAFLLMLEGRAPWEYAAMVAAMPWLRKLPTGDGHPILVFPGLGAADRVHDRARQGRDYEAETEADRGELGRHHRQP